MNKRQKKKLRKKLEQRRQVETLERVLWELNHQSWDKAFERFIERMADVSYAISRLAEHWRELV